MPPFRPVSAAVVSVSVTVVSKGVAILKNEERYHRLIVYATIVSVRITVVCECYCCVGGGVHVLSIYHSKLQSDKRVSITPTPVYSLLFILVYSVNVRRYLF